MGLHADIMNLPCNSFHAGTPDAQLAYKEGHKRARHDAAELALSAEAELEAWRSRFPNMVYRPQDGCVALKFEQTSYGCHCDLGPGEKPDYCWIDRGVPNNCSLAIQLLSDGKGRDDCPEWRRVEFANLGKSGN